MVRSFLFHQVEHRAPVNRVILGTHSTGTSLTKGEVIVELDVPDTLRGSDEPVFVVRFRGTTDAKTVGANGPALVDARTSTEFHCSRPIHFDPDRGFVPGRATAQTDTRLEYEGFRAARPGVGSRMISRLAARRAAESKAEATQIVSAIQQDELVKNFEAKLDERLRSLNTKLTVARWAAGVIRPGTRLCMQTRPTPEGLLVGFGPGKEVGQIPELPIQSSTGSKVEVWVHTSLLEPRRGNWESFAALAGEMDRWNAWTRRTILASSLVTAAPVWGASRRGGNELDPGSRWIGVGLGGDEAGTVRLATTARSGESDLWAPLLTALVQTWQATERDSFSPGSAVLSSTTPRAP